MFLRKMLFGHKIGWVIIDLFVVIVGVYSAFLIQKSSEDTFNKKEKEKVLTALKFELETFRFQFPKFADFTTNYYNQIKNEEKVDFSDWRFAEPQYAYQIIEYALEINNNEIVDFQLYDQLQRQYVLIKQLEFAERKITEMADKYKQLIPELNQGHPLNLERKADNRTTFHRFKLFLRSRIGGLKRASDASNDALALINAQLGSVKSLAIEREFLKANAKYADSEQDAVEICKKLFPHITEDEIKSIYRQAKNSNE